MKKLTLSLLVVLLLSATAMAGQIDGARLWTAPDHSRLVLDVDSAIKHSSFTLQSPYRLVVDFKKTRLGSAFKAAKLQDRRLKGLRHAPRPQGGARVVLDLHHAVKPNIFMLEPNGEYGHRLVIDLHAKQATAETPVKEAAKTKVAKVAKSQADIEKLRDVVVAVDAGHGGEDPGAIGRTHRTKEKLVTLQIARRLKRLIDAQPGMRAVLTRNGDYYVGLRKRMALARAKRADLFVSIHADAFHDKRVRGSSVFVLSRRGASSEAARWLAARENAADLVGGVSLDDKDDVLASVLLDLSQSASREASLTAAQRVFQRLEKIGKTHGRHKVQQAAFMVLKSPDVPSMLIETGFISNPGDERNLRSHKYQERLAGAIMQGIRSYFKTAPPPGTLIAKLERDNRPKRHVISKGDTLSHIAERYEVSLASLRKENRITNDRGIRVGQVLRIPGA